MSLELKPYLQYKEPPEKPGIFRAQGIEDNRIEKRTLAMRRLEMVNNLNHYIACQATSERRVLREKQMDVFVDIKNFLKKGGTEGYIEAPTGFGKTVLFLEILKATDQRTLVVVPTRVLVEQTYERFMQSNPELEVGKFYTDKKELGRKVTITTYDSFIMANGGINPSDIDLLILDEAHKSTSKKRTEAVDKFKNAIKLGFTATSEYRENKSVKNLLKNEIHNISLKEGIELGLLSSFTVYLAETNVNLSKVSIDNNGDFDQKKLEAAINIQSRNKSAVELYQKLIEQKPELSKALINCVSIDHAKEVARLFREAGISAEAIYNGLNHEKRKDIIKRYKEGKVNILTNVNILTEGFDDYKAYLVINLRPTSSKVVAKQRGGRVLRLDPENPNKHAIIIDYLDKDEDKRNLQLTFAQVAGGVQILNPGELNITQKEKNGLKNKSKAIIDKPQIQIKGLKVVTETEQVLKIINNLEPRDPLLEEMKKKIIIPVDNSIQDIQPTDFVISSNNLSKIFEGSEDKLLFTANNIVDSLLEQTPGLIVARKSSDYENVMVLKRTNLFFRLMQRNGFMLKPDARIAIFP